MHSLYCEYTHTHSHNTHTHTHTKSPYQQSNLQEIVQCRHMHIHSLTHVGSLTHTQMLPGRHAHSWK